jgi:hypothetical protein
VQASSSHRIRLLNVIGTLYRGIRKECDLATIKLLCGKRYRGDARMAVHVVVKKVKIKA